MTADQAFIKAYTQQDDSTVAMPSGGPSAVSLADALEDQVPRATAAGGTAEAAGPGPEPARPAHLGNRALEAAPTLEALDLPGAVFRIDTTSPTAESGPLRTTPPSLDEVIAPEELSGGTPADWEPTVQTAGPDPRPAKPFRPAFQVDRFLWPKVCRRIVEEAGGELDRLCDGLLSAAGAGHKLLAFCGLHPGDGVTTLVVCVARALAERGLRMALVDGNPENPRLAERLGLLPEVGWEEVLDGRLPLDEVAVESTEDQLVVLPLCEPLAAEMPQRPDRPGCLAEGLRSVRESYELVLLDAGPFGAASAAGPCWQGPLAGRADAVVLIDNVAATSRDSLAQLRRHLADREVPLAGIIQNRVRR